MTNVAIGVAKYEISSLGHLVSRYDQYGVTCFGCAHYPNGCDNRKAGCELVEMAKRAKRKS